MDNFTKNELALLLDAINFWNMQTDEAIKEEVLLSCKIESMIDNYCEHESSALGDAGLISSCDGDINNPLKCTKCGELYR